MKLAGSILQGGKDDHDDLHQRFLSQTLKRVGNTIMQQMFQNADGYVQSGWTLTGGTMFSGGDVVCTCFHQTATFLADQFDDDLGSIEPEWKFSCEI